LDSAKINDWAQVIGIFALVASLMFVGLQMKQDREIAAGDNTLLVISERQVEAGY
jgi:hypothetical protein